MYEEKHWRTQWKEIRRKWLLWMLPPLLSRGIRALGSLLNIKIDNPKRFQAISEHDGPVLFAFWHGRMLLMPHALQRYLPKRNRVWILISQHWDGEVIARTVHNFGVSAIRGSSTRGGGMAFLRMVRSAKMGNGIAISPDGPRGPRYHVQLGVVRLARLTGAPIVPVTYSARPCWLAPSWDKFLVPFPFGRALFVFGDSIRVPSKVSESEEQGYRMRLEESLNAITREADEALDHTRLMGLFFVLYNLLLIPISILVLPYMLRKLLTTAKLQRGLPERLGIIRPHRLPYPTTQRPLWVHAVSVGEVMAIVPFIRIIRKRYPNLPVVISTITITGQETAERQIPDADAIIYFPFDYPWIVARSLRTIRPRLFVHTETEIWPNFLFLIERMGIPSVIINGRISETSCRRYGWFRFFFRKVLTPIEAFGMQSKMDCLRVIRIGADPRRVFVTGNMKFDHTSAAMRPEDGRDLKASLGLPEQARIFVAGSTHSGEEEIVCSVFRRLQSEFKDLKLVIAPRHPERFAEAEKLARATGYRVVRRNQLLNPTLAVHKEDKDIIILDTIGELARVYALGTIIFVGGSLVKVGGHNLLEPIAYKKAVLFGPHMENAVEIAEALKRVGGGIEVSDAETLYQEARRLLSDEESRDRIGEAAFGIIKEHHGATERNLSVLQTFLNP